MVRWRTATSGGLLGASIGIMLGFLLIEDGTPGRVAVLTGAGLGFSGALAGAAMIGLDRSHRR
jgi:hypothetical protein